MDYFWRIKAQGQPTGFVAQEDNDQSFWNAHGIIYIVYIERAKRSLAYIVHSFWIDLRTALSEGGRIQVKRILQFHSPPSDIIP